RAVGRQRQAQGECREAQCIRRCGAGRASGPTAPRRSWPAALPARPADGGVTRRVAEGGNREVVAADQGGRDQAGMMRAPGNLEGNDMTFPHRRRFVHLAAGAAVLPIVPRIARAQTYPARPVTLIVPFAAAGPTDVAARIVSEHMSRTLGQRLVVENAVGAGGTTGSLRAMRANPDGYTIQMGHMGTHAISVSLYPNLAYKPDIDFEPIGVVVTQPLLIVARKDFPAADIREFI